MKKVFVLFNGCYSDTRVVGVYSSQENADLAARIFSDDASVSEYDIDPHVAGMKRGEVPFFVRMKRDTGDVMECERRESSYSAFDSSVGVDVHKNLYTFCWAKNRDTAIKIAGDRRRMFLANPGATSAEP